MTINLSDETIDVLRRACEVALVNFKRSSKAAIADTNAAMVLLADLKAAAEREKFNAESQRLNEQWVKVGP